MRLARAAAESIDTEGYGSLGEAAGDGEAEESGRLVYVAASRAERRLILSGVYADRDLEENEKPRRNRTALGCLLPGLGVEGVDGQRVSVPAPSARAGLEGDTNFGEVEIAVRVIGAGAESARRLAADVRTPAAPAPLTDASAAPLIALADGGAAAARSLSYVALADYGRCGYRFLIERVIGLGGGLPAATPEATGGSRLDPDSEEAAGLDWDERLPGPGDSGEPEDGGEAVSPALRHARMGFGRAVHELLEWSARNGWTLPDERVRAAALAREGAAPDADDRLLSMLEGWLASPLLAELRGSGAALRPEVGFRLALGAGTILRGTIDLLGEARAGGSGGEVTVVDYKTDRLGSREPALDEGYLIQRSLYAAAVAEATGAESVRSAYVFLERPDAPVVSVLDAAEIAAGRSQIEEAVAEIRAGHFEATTSPHRDLCHDCPVRARLCPHPREITGRSSPEPPVEPVPAGIGTAKR